MWNEKKYTRLINRLKNSSPELEFKEVLVDEIMERIRKPEPSSGGKGKLIDYIFGWSGIYWLRGSMAAIAAVFVGVFIFQQVSIANRFDSLENQLVNTVNVLQSFEPQLGISQKVFLKMISSDDDSITVSRTDLEKMLNLYMELQKANEEINQESISDPHNQREIRKNAVKKSAGDKS
jgi:hypothetical protein